MIFNTGGIVYFIRSEGKGHHSKAFIQWLGDNATSSAALVFLAATNLGVLRGIDAKLFRLQAFSAPLSKEGAILASSIGLLSNLSEDLPQLIVRKCVGSLGGYAAVMSFVLVCCFRGVGTIAQLHLSPLTPHLFDAYRSRRGTCHRRVGRA